MRRPPGRRARLAVAFGVFAGAAAAAVAALASGCHRGVTCATCQGPACRATCPRDSARDETGRCACLPGDVLTLGACAPPAVGDAFCGPAARMRSDGCVFHTCSADEALDLAVGGCVPRAALLGGGLGGCGDAGAPLVESGRAECVPREAVCPRGTRLENGACARAPTCPAGTLPDGAGAPSDKLPDGAGAPSDKLPDGAGAPSDKLPWGKACQPVVTEGAGGGRRSRVDVGAWAALVLGVDGGRGSEELCRPIAQRPAAFGLGPGQSLTVRLRLSLRVPDQDLAAVHADVHAVADPSTRPLPPAAENLVRAAVTSVVEPLRSLGGEASAAAVDMEVRCSVASL